MDCRDRILSNNYYDVVIDFPIDVLRYDYFDLCYVNVDEFYNIVYINRENIRNVSTYIFDCPSCMV